MLSDIKTEYSVAVEFLESLRPSGPWVLTAIIPDGDIETVTVHDEGEVDAFVGKHDGRRNIYYSANSTRTEMSKKAAKTDIAAIEYALADLDPNDGETPEEAKKRYLAELEKIEPRTTAVIDSGNGIQCLWKLKERIVLGEPIWVDGEKLEFSPEDQTKIADVEDRIKAMMLRLGSKAGTQNIDRILRLPGTTNLPNEKKRRDGRSACPTRLISFRRDVVVPLETFPKEVKKKANGHAGDDIIDVTLLMERLSAATQKLITSAPQANEDRSAIAGSVIFQMMHAGISNAGIRAVFEAHPNGIGARYSEKKNDIADDIERQRKKFEEATHEKPKGAKSSANPEHIRVVRASNVEQKSVKWIWKDRLAEGKITIIGGQPGNGKSQITCDIIGRITRSRKWHDGGVAPLGNCVILSAEDAASDTICPRLEAVGADLDRVFILQAVVNSDGRDTTFNLGRDLELLAETIKSVGNVSLIVIDPITAYLGDRIDSHQTTAVRAVLHPLDKFAEQHNVAILAITHPPKATQTTAMNTFTGSLAFAAAPRVCLVAVEEPDGDGRRLLLGVKNTNGPLPAGIGYRLVPKVTALGIEACHIEWDDQPVTITANEAIRATSSGGRQQQAGLTDEAEEFLASYLGDGPKPQDKVLEAATTNGISLRTLYRAKKNLGVDSKKEEGVFKGNWNWALPYDR